MKKIQLIIPFIFLFQLTYAQTAEELNKQANEHIKMQEFDKAFPVLKKSAQLGNSEAQYNLGYLLQNGIGTEKNLSEAVEWYKKSSDNNFNDAHYALMMAFGNGDGVEQNSSKAFEYAMKCATNNDPTCTWNVVDCYMTGNGVEISESKIKEWIIRLAKLENPENLTQSAYITSARLEIARYYKTGKYFEKDLYLSYLWYLIFNESKRDFSILVQQEGLDEIKEIEKTLTKDQILNGKLEAEKILGRQLANYSELYKTSL